MQYAEITYVSPNTFGFNLNTLLVFFFVGGVLRFNEGVHPSTGGWIIPWA